MNELGDRVIAALYLENGGNRYQRMNYVAELALEALYRAAERPFTVCKFHNKWGWCKLEEGHSASHSVIYLGEDD